MNSKITKKLNSTMTAKKMNKLLKYYTKMTDDNQEKFDYLREDQFMHCTKCNVIFDTTDLNHSWTSSPVHNEDTLAWSKCLDCIEAEKRCSSLNEKNGYKKKEEKNEVVEWMEKIFPSKD